MTDSRDNPSNAATPSDAEERGIPASGTPRTAAATSVPTDAGALLVPSTTSGSTALSQPTLGPSVTGQGAEALAPGEDVNGGRGRGPDEIDALRDAVNEAAKHVTTRFATFLFITAYLAVTVSATTDEDLLRESPLQLPLLGIGLPLVPFYITMPWIYLVMHGYLLFQLLLLSEKVQAFLEAIPNRPELLRQRARLFPFPTLHLLVRADADGPVKGAALHLVNAIHLVVPLLMLMGMLWRFLPYHHAWGHGVQRAAILADLVMLWLMWPIIARARGAVRDMGYAGLPSMLDGAMATLAEWARNARFFVTAFIYKMTETAILMMHAIGPWRAPASVIVLFVSFRLLVVPGGALDSFVPMCTLSDTGKDGTEGKRLYHWRLGEWSLGRIALRDYEAWISRLFGRRVPGIDRNWLEPWVHRNLDLGGRTLVKEPPPPELLARYVELGDEDSREARIEECWQRHSIGLDLAGRDLRGAYLEGAKLYNANLREANLSDAVMRQIQCQGADLSVAFLDRVDLNSGHLERVRAIGARFRNAAMPAVRLEAATLSGAHLQAADLTSAHLERSRLNAARFEGARLVRARLDRANLRQARLRAAQLWYAHLGHADLRDAHLEAASLRSARLAGANLSRAILWGADLRGTDLVGANLANVSLEGAILVAPNHRNTHVSTAVLRACLLQYASLEGVFGEPAIFEANDIRMLREAEYPTTEMWHEFSDAVLEVIPEGRHRHDARQQLADAWRGIQLAASEASLKLEPGGDCLVDPSNNWRSSSAGSAEAHCRAVILVDLACESKWVASAIASRASGYVHNHGEAHIDRSLGVVLARALLERRATLDCEGINALSDDNLAQLRTIVDDENNKHIVAELEAYLAEQRAGEEESGPTSSQPAVSQPVGSR